MQRAGASRLAHPHGAPDRGEGHCASGLARTIQIVANQP